LYSGITLLGTVNASQFKNHELEEMITMHAILELGQRLHTMAVDHFTTNNKELFSAAVAVLTLLDLEAHPVLKSIYRLAKGKITMRNYHILAADEIALAIRTMKER
jgi:hypothetical protein